jgi:hypothetical protein
MISDFFIKYVWSTMVFFVIARNEVTKQSVDIEINYWDCFAEFTPFTGPAMAYTANTFLA